MKLCRICDRPSSEVRDVFSKNVDGKQILQLIRETLPAVIYRNDPLSKQICLSCLENVNRIHNFRKSCLKVVDKHKEALKGNESKDTLLYLQLLDSIDQKELWMYSSPIKKTFNKETPMCFNCKTELFSPKIEKPFKKYKELPRKSEDEDEFMNGYDDYESTPNINNKRKRLPIVDLELITAGSLPKRKKIIGPKCVSQPFIKSNYTEIKTYSPLTLLNLALNVINKSILPDVITKPFEHYKENVYLEEKVTYSCGYCMEPFDNQSELAKHEINHMKMNLNRVDNIEIWNTSFEESSIRNKWLHTIHGEEYLFDENEEEEEEDENLLVPLSESGDEIIGDIELIDTKPVVNGISLGDIPKNERRTYYNKNYVVNGLKRKFCPLCRYTFKDNWAIELHYFSSACYYTCRYCGIRFNKQRAIFDEHVNLHVQRGDPISDQVYASKKKNDPVPKVLCQGNSRTAVCVSPPQTESSTPKLRVIKPRTTSEINNSVIEEEQKATSPTTSGGQSQAYFCRKCYKVFFMLNEFNQHTEICQGLIDDEPNVSQERKPQLKPQLKPQIKPQIKPEHKPKYHRGQLTTPPSLKINEASIKVSSTGRPVRNCVRDVKYKDNVDADIEKEDKSNSRSKSKTQSFDFECVVCHAIFPTMLSRNSHMRVHKNGFKPAQKPESVCNNTYESYEEVMSFKQEQLEPLVEIHETNAEQELPSNIGAVSITPIPNKRHKTSINPDIMRLVQSNPNITIRTMSQSPLEPQTMLTEGGSGSDDGVRTYKCSSCNKAFTSKSTLYFHKKHQCEGSRFPCPFCKKRFGTESAYSAHIFYSHPE